MNPLTPNTSFGTAAELLVQLRLWQFGVQAAPPLKDSGNDLITVHRHEFRALQVKGTRGEAIQIKTKHLVRADGSPRLFHILALVFAPPVPDVELWTLDEALIYLVDRPDEPCTFHKNDDALEHARFSRGRIAELWNVG